jgi:hypothetical protein
MNMSLITSTELCQRSGLDRFQLWAKRRQYPDQLVPARRIGRNLMWTEDTVALLIGLQMRRRTRNAGT